ncbi:MAG: sulfurtransferase-like selenium metabolism protein YedF [Candidatus Obscuribacterales bacterium]|nr:sulfurtransferase-like selenium metabolism protein YedF [Candidatus Obscuribacterales bacterium]
MQRVDLRNLSCPEPVLRTKKLFDDPNVEAAEVLVDDEVSVRNLERLSKYLKASVSSKKTDKGFQVTLKRTLDPKVILSASEESPVKDGNHGAKSTTVVFLSKDTFGEGDEEFSRTLLNLFLQTLFETGQRPQAILMANSGVKLMAKSSAVLRVLQDFQKEGVEVAACGLCVDYYGLKEDIPVPQITNMFAICEYLTSAEKVLSP